MIMSSRTLPLRDFQARLAAFESESDTDESRGEPAGGRVMPVFIFLCRAAGMSESFSAALPGPVPFLFSLRIDS
jgi:hypothetical protein